MYQKPSEKSWKAYQLVNRLMADLVASKTGLNDTIIINDYHFLCLPQLLKQRRPDLKVIFYLHTPFPPIEIFFNINQSETLLLSMLVADIIGVQTDNIRKNIVSCMEFYSSKHKNNKIMHKAKIISPP